jgi:RNA polymerase sigma-70 factor (ECF subfamily)
LESGEPDAIEAFAEAARRELMSLARRWVHDPALIEDVVQEALLEALASHAALRDPAALRAWLALIVRKQADRATRRNRPTTWLGQVAELPDASDVPERVAERRNDVATIRLGLSLLPDADALLLRLRYFGEWTDAELAALVGAKPGPVRKRIHAARRRLRAALETAPTTPTHPYLEETMPELSDLFGRVITPADVPAGEPAERTPSGTRLETKIKVVDAVVPLELGGTIDLLGPEGLGQLVLVVEIAAHVGAVIVAAGASPHFAGLIDDELPVEVVLVDGAPAEASIAAVRLAGQLADGGRTVLLVLDVNAWSSHPPAAGTAAEGNGSVTAFRFAPHPRDGDPLPGLDGAGTSIVYSTTLFVNGLHPAIDVTASQSALVDDERLDAVTVGAARAARAALTKAAAIRAFLAQPLIVGEPHTGVPGEQIPAQTATESLTALVR